MKALYTIVGIQHSSLASTLPIKKGMNVLLLREPDNPYDPNAVRCYVDIGYIKKEQAKDLAPRLDKDLRHYAISEGEIESVSAAAISLEVEENDNA